MFRRSAAVFFRRSSTLVLVLLLAGYVFWMLSLPAWPSQDGPVHLYYTRVLDVLFSHSPSPFRAQFFIKHILPPYALYYYALLLLSHIVPLLTADRVVICGYITSFVLGFRYAARALGPNAHVTSLLGSLLVLNWALGMGFTNFCLSLSFALWAIGLWLRLGSAPIGSPRQLGKRLGFVALLVVITLTHPVPLLLVLAFAGLDLVCRWLVARRSRLPVDTKHFTNALITLASGSLCLAYVKAFTVAHPLAQRATLPGSFAQHIARRIKDLVTMKNVELLHGHWWEIEAYRACLLLILFFAAILAVQQFRRNRARGLWTPSDTMTVFAVCFVVLLPLLPSDMSGAYYFFERLNGFVWITMLLAASGWSPAESTHAAALPLRRSAAAKAALLETGTAIFAAAITILLLHTANTTLRPFADRDFRLAHTELPLRGALAMVLDGGMERKYMWAGPPWDPYYWDTVAVLRHNDAIMVNAPWLDSPIIPLGETTAQPGRALPPTLANSPLSLGDSLKNTPTLRRGVLDKSAVAFFSPVGPGSRTAVPALLGSGWSCSESPERDYRLCTRVRGETVARLFR